MRFSKGEQIAFADEPRNPYTVRSIDARYAVCTRPIDPVEDAELLESSGYDEPPEGVPIYTIVDRDEMIRGEHDIIFNPYDFATDEGCDECLADLNLPEDAIGRCRISRRTYKRVPLVLADDIHQPQEREPA